MAGGLIWFSFGGFDLIKVSVQHGPENGCFLMAKLEKFGLEMFKLLKLPAQTPGAAHELMCNKRAKSSSGGAHGVILCSRFPLFTVKDASCRFKASPNSSLLVCTDEE